MKNIFLFIVFLFIFSICIGQSVPQKQYSKKSNYQENKTEFIDYTNWELSNEGCWGCASFYWKVIKTKTPINEDYYYYIYFYSNSFQTNGIWTSTYLWNIYLTVDKYKMNTEPVWITFRESFTPSMLWFKTKSSSPHIYFTWGGKKIL